VKQHLAAILMLFDWLIVGQVVGQNPAAAVRGPKHLVKKGKTPVLDGDEAKQLLASIDTSTVISLRDRALIALLIYSFARISAALHMNVADYYPQGKRWRGSGYMRKAVTMAPPLLRRISVPHIGLDACRPDDNSTANRVTRTKGDAGTSLAFYCRCSTRANTARTWSRRSA
jgi:integrase